MPYYKKNPYTGREKSPVIDDYARVVSYDADGNQVVAFVKVEYPIDLGYGEVSDWSLDNMLKAGINPQSMNIHTSTSTRLETSGDLDTFIAEAEAIINETETNND